MSDFPQKCSICSSLVADDEEQFTFGWLGSIPISLCVWCFSGLNDFFNQPGDE